MLLGVQVTAGLGFFSASNHLVNNKDNDSLLHQALAFFAGPQWGNVMESNFCVNN